MKILKPGMIRNSLTSVTPDDIRSADVRVIAVDADNTSSFDGTTVPLDGTAEWMACMKENGYRIVLLSNAKTERAEALAKAYDIPVVGLAMKPLPFGYWRAALSEHVKPHEVVMIGDQLFTDILGANISGCKSIFVKPYEVEKRGKIGFAVKRGLERVYFSALGLIERK